MFEVEIERDVEMAARDGTILRADIYRPQTGGDVPAILVRTPYDKSRDVDQTEAHFFAPRGYMVVVQDVRGMWASDGTFYPRVYEAEDGYDAVQWTAGLPGCDGRVGMAGQSYITSAQFAAASLRPPALKACSPVAGPARASRAQDGGLIEWGWSLPYYIYCARATLRRAGLSHTFRDKFEEWLIDRRQPFSMLKEQWFKHLPLSDWSDWLGDIAPYIRDMVELPLEHDFWKPFDLAQTPEAFDVPMLHVGSWYDAYSTDILGMYDALRKGARTQYARDNQRLIMGPWAHLFTFAVPTSGGTGEADFGPNSVVELHALQLPFFERHLRDQPLADAEEPPVRLFVMGDNVWRDEAEWPPRRAELASIHLDSAGHANTRNGDGTLTLAVPEKDATDTYSYDPNDPVPTRGGNGLGQALGVFDQKPTELRDDVLVYTGAALEADLEICGPMELVLHASSSAVDTDFIARLVDVHPDGYAQNLMEGALRTRYRQMPPSLIEPGRIYEFTIKLGAMTHVFKAGHRLRLQITSSNFPRFDRNLNTGAALDDARVVTAVQTIYHGPSHPTRLSLPVIARKMGAEVAPTDQAQSRVAAKAD